MSCCPYPPAINYHLPPQYPAPDWDRVRCKETCDGRPPMKTEGCRFPLIQARPCCPTDGSGDACSTFQPQPTRCTLPPITNRNVCGNHPRDDCCRVPQCNPCLPRCPMGIYVERVQPKKPENRYEPPAEPFSGCSTYRSHYMGPCGLPARSFKPKSYFDPSSGKMDGLTMYRKEFTCKPIMPIERFKTKNEYVPSCQPMDGCSTYRLDFKGCYGQPARTLKPRSTFDESSGKMDGMSTYRHEFIPYCPSEYQYAKGESIKPAESNGMSCAPFDACSTYRMEYVPKCMMRTPSMKPKDMAGFSTAAFNGRTSYRTDFLPFHFEKCPGPCIPEEYYKPYCC